MQAMGKEAKHSIRSVMPDAAIKTSKQQLKQSRRNHSFFYDNILPQQPKCFTAALYLA